MAFNNLNQLQDNQKAKDDLDAYLRIARLLRFYGKVLAGTYILKGQAKADVAFMHNSVNSFLNRFKSGIRADAMEAFERELSKDFHAWGEIIQALTYLNDEQTEAIEKICLGVASGNIAVELSDDGKEIFINKEKL